MKFSFDGYQFDCDKKILTREGEVVPLNEKAAKLLALFLLNQDKVIAKDEILDTVWAQRVVTEQVVFQNISQLRSLFGTTAIKTFSKMGYQWQLATCKISDDEPQNLTISVDDSTSQSSQQNTQLDTDTLSSGVTEKLVQQSREKIVSTRILAIAGGLLVVFVCVWLLLSYKELSYEKLSHQKLNHQNGQPTAEQNAEQVFQLNSGANNRTLLPSITAQQVIDSPVKHRNELGLSPSQLLVATQLYSFDNRVALRFYVQGAHRNWHDHIVATTEQQARQALTSLLNLIVGSKYFSIKTDHGALAELTVLNHELPNNHHIKRQLLKAHLLFEQLPQANALLAELQSQVTNNLDKGLLLYLQNDAAMKAKDWPLARQSIAKAISLFEQIGLSHVTARAYISSSWGYMVEQQFREGMAKLNRAVTHARKANQAFLEVEANAIQAYFAQKSGEVELAHAQLDLAMQLLQLHHVGNEHMALILYYSGWVEQSQQKKAAVYEQLVNLPYNGAYRVYFYGAAEWLRDYYLQQRNFDKARETVKDWQLDSVKQLAQANIEFALKNDELGLQYTERAFHLGQLELSRYTALDAALLLLQRDSHLQQPAKAYIEQQATARWLDQNPAVKSFIH